MSYTFDGQPPVDTHAVLQSMLAAAWERGRDAAVQKLEQTSSDGGWGPGGEAYRALVRDISSALAESIEALAPPADLAAALTEHARRAAMPSDQRHQTTIATTRLIAPGWIAPEVRAMRASAQFEPMPDGIYDALEAASVKPIASLPFCLTDEELAGLMKMLERSADERRQIAEALANG